MSASDLSALLLDAIKKLPRRSKAKCVLVSPDRPDEVMLVGTQDSLLNLAIAILETVSHSTQKHPDEEGDFEDCGHYKWFGAITAVTHALPGGHPVLSGCCVFESYQKFLEYIDDAVRRTSADGIGILHDPQLTESEAGEQNQKVDNCSDERFRSAE